MSPTEAPVTRKYRKRRIRSLEEKLELLKAATAPGGSVHGVAVRNDIEPSLLFQWRKRLRHLFMDKTD